MIQIHSAQAFFRSLTVNSERGKSFNRMRNVFKSPILLNLFQIHLFLPNADPTTPMTDTSGHFQLA